ncbi:MAG: type II toxin-antitoxin system death-on-curing family toxin [Clostridia bacterium]|nr:type II toxin-antitoxin system death-on-curing family toxin [Clostridia bacterium]
MTRLFLEDILALHPLVSEKSGGGTGLRDRGLLESAVLSADASFGGIEIYPTVEEKAARLAYAIISNHPFLDGNKRMGILCLLLTLRLNRISLSYTQEELACLGLSAAAGSLDYEGILAWVVNHKV